MAVAAVILLLFLWMVSSTYSDVASDRSRCAELYTTEECRQLFAHPEWSSCRVLTDSFDRCAARLLD